jgi:predicted RNA-binding protein YlqC (UPF0109 family)
LTAVATSRREKRINVMHGDDNDDQIRATVAEDGEEYEEFDEAELDLPAGDLADSGPPSDVAERLRGLVVYLATNLVDDPNSVEVEARQRGNSVFVSLRVPEEELGKVIGRGGRIARAMRTALLICGSRSNVRASLDIED